MAQVGGFRPPDDPLGSWFGGTFVGLPDEQWPTFDGRKMWPLLQARIDELPFVPDELAEIALMTVFVTSEYFAVDNARNGDGWLLRTYASTDGLQPLSDPPEDSQVRRFPIRWEHRSNEAPDWEDHGTLPEGASDALSRAVFDAFHDEYDRAHATKIGGWPAYVQGTLTVPGRFVFQIDTEEKAHWSWGDNGTAYFCRDEHGEWWMEWQCF